MSILLIYSSAAKFEIFASNDTDSKSSSHVTCYQHPNTIFMNQTPMEIMCFQPVWGRYLFISTMVSSLKVNLCEVQIYGGKPRFKLYSSLSKCF